MKTSVQLKKPYGEATFSRVRHARYLGWEDAFEVEFEDGLCFLEPHAAIRKANRTAKLRYLGPIRFRELRASCQVDLA